MYTNCISRKKNSMNEEYLCVTLWSIVIVDPNYYHFVELVTDMIRMCSVVTDRYSLIKEFYLSCKDKAYASP